MKTFKDWTHTKEMEDWFKKRTNRHIELVRKYGKIIFEYDPVRFKDLPKQLAIHDDSKFVNPERDPYVFITWQYHCKDKGIPFEVPEDLGEKLSQATLHHVTTNSHHPEYYSPEKTELINRENRDKPPEKMVDATKMPDVDIAEMVSDWCGVSEEKGNTPKSWADKNVNIRWKFTSKQVDLIYELIDYAWKKADKNNI